MAGSLGGVLVGLGKGLSNSLVLLVAASLSTFLFLVAAVAWLYCAQGLRGMVRKLRSINAVRRYFLDLGPENARYFLLPTTDSIPDGQNLGGWPAPVFMGTFAVALSFGSTLLWLALFTNNIQVLAGVRRFAVALVVPSITVGSDDKNQGANPSPHHRNGGSAGHGRQRRLMKVRR